MIETPPTVVVIPTYNEKKNIAALCSRIIDLNLPELTIVIVDDNSPDGTGAAADELSRSSNGRIHVLHRQRKAGLGPAYVAGFRFALSHGAEYIFEMDADFSHDPERIPAFLDEIKKCDLVLGSRYVPGGRIENWNIIRRLVSYFGNLYARVVLGVAQKDLTSGYKCYRRRVIEALNVDTLSSLGYVFQIETTYKALKAGFSVREIPITFTERREGDSKFNFGIFIGAFVKVLMLRFKTQ